MAKDYFQDILPPQEGGKRQKAPRSVSLNRDPDMRPAPVVAATESEEEEINDDEDTIEIPEESAPLEHAPERSIRNISAPARRARDDMQDAPRYSPPMQRPKRSYKMWVWFLAAIGVLMVGALLMVALRGTSVSVIPRSHTVVFDETSRFTAYPEGSAAAGSLTYTTQTITLEETEPVKSSGSVHSETKTSGTIVVYNNSSATAYRLIKNTRFESEGGLIFRAQADIEIPGRSGTTPGQVTVSVVAEQAGEQYNIAAGKLTVPGLKGGADFDKVYAEAKAPLTGGFVGDRPGVSEADMAGAKAAVRGRLEQKVREAVAALGTESAMAFPEVATVTYEDLPTTTGEDGGARIGEKATVLAPVIASPQLAIAVARTVSADSDNAQIRIVGIRDFGGLPVMASSTVGTDPVQFTLTGQAILVWEVNATELAQALAGRDQSAFQTIVTGFPGIQSATARIEPFWSDSFPSEAGKIRVKIEDPSAQ